MMNITQKMLLFTFLAACPSFAAAGACDSLQTVHWLLGDWIADSGEHVTLESWTEVSAGTFEGAGETRSRTTNELVSRESLRLMEMSGELFYLAKVGSNDLPVAFKLTECSGDSAIFENAEHDFPKRLEYRLAGDDKMIVTVTDGKERGFKVSFIKRNDG
jgi:hypothetical protein